MRFAGLGTTRFPAPYFGYEKGKAEYVRVKIGRFARKSVLLPVHLVAVHRERRTLKLG